MKNATKCYPQVHEDLINGIISVLILTRHKVEYAEIAKQSRIKVLELVYNAQSSHIGSLFSCADIMAVLSEQIDWDKDKFILSAGWKVCILYYHLWRKGRISLGELDSYCQEGSKFIGLAEPVIPEIPFAGGSMGMGLPAAVGFALAKKIKGEEGQVYCLMSDGEMAIGTTHEAMLIAHQHELENLTIIVDNNGLQAMGKTKDILAVPYGHLDAARIDGHNYTQIKEALNGLQRIIIADTVKGKGVSFMQNNNLYHYKNLDEAEYLKAKAELCQ